jgi:hypothetical protein
MQTYELLNVCRSGCTQIKKPEFAGEPGLIQPVLQNYSIVVDPTQN